MAIKIFLLGRPGSGKSTAARHIEAQVKGKVWETVHINDYKFLRAMFEADTCKQKFSPTGCGGFDVIDFAVLDAALQNVEDEVWGYMNDAHKLLLLEFARNDYYTALQQFQPIFLSDAYFLFFQADINLCIERVYTRSCQPTYTDDHFISEEMIRSYYAEENQPARTYSLLERYGISDKRVRVIDNSSNVLHLAEQIEHFMSVILEQHEQERQLSYHCLCSREEGREHYNVPSACAKKRHSPFYAITCGKKEASQV